MRQKRKIDGVRSPAPVDNLSFVLSNSMKGSSLTASFISRESPLTHFRASVFSSPFHSTIRCRCLVLHAPVRNERQSQSRVSCQLSRCCYWCHVIYSIGEERRQQGQEEARKRGVSTADRIVSFSFFFITNLSSRLVDAHIINLAIVYFYCKVFK